MEDSLLSTTMDNADSDYKAGSKYALPRNEAELRRLNMQHEYVKITVYEGRLIFDESIKLGPDSAVLDSGTGTGAWVMDLAQSVPSSLEVELYGSDVSAYHFPQTHPANVHFVEASSTSFPEEWTGKFDVVNQRLLVAALLTNEWPVALSEVLRVLKPGGYAQFAEMDCKIMFVNGGPACRRYQGLVEKVYEKQGFFLDAAQQIPRMMEDVGFTETVSEKKLGGIGDSWGGMGKMGTESILGAIRNTGAALIKSGVIGKDELDWLIANLEDELEKAEGTQLVYRMICARKPA